MALKRKINKETFDKLSDEMKKEYKKGSSEDEYLLDTEGDEDTGALKRAKDREAQARKDAEERAEKLQAELDELSGNDAKKKGDIATLEKSWQGKLDKQKGEYDAKVNKLTSHSQRMLVDNVALQIATKISKAPALLLPHIKSRLAADFDGDEPATRVLDAGGKVSALTLADLEKEFVSNKDFADIIIGSKASGGAGSPSQSRFGGGAPANNGNQPPNLAAMNPKQLAEHVAAQKANQQQ